MRRPRRRQHPALGEAPWIALGEKPSRVVTTGDPRFPALLIAGEAARLYDRRTGDLVPVALPVPARDVAAALVLGDRLLVGTSGYGLLSGAIGEIAAAAAGNGP